MCFSAFSEAWSHGPMASSPVRGALHGAEPALGPDRSLTETLDLWKDELGPGCWRETYREKLGWLVVWNILFFHILGIFGNNHPNWLILLDLIGGLEHEFYDFPYIGKNHPNWRTHIFRGVGIPPTSGRFKHQTVMRFWKTWDFAIKDVDRCGYMWFVSPIIMVFEFYHSKMSLPNWWIIVPCLILFASLTGIYMQPAKAVFMCIIYIYIYVM